jgi:hypothetical protein
VQRRHTVLVLVPAVCILFFEKISDPTGRSVSSCY